MAPFSQEAATGLPSSISTANESSGSVGFMLQSSAAAEVKSCGSTTGDNSMDTQRLRRHHHHLSRLVSLDEQAKDSVQGSTAVAAAVPPMPNPLQNVGFLRNHVASLRLETDLYPLRLIVSRLMNNQTHNRKGIFNQPVDPVALGLLDYTLIITRPMDLGTVKRRLHAVAYASRQEAAEDIRLVFTNAMLYNPPHNIIHKCASELLAFFDSYYQSLDPCVIVNNIGSGFVNDDLKIKTKEAEESHAAVVAVAQSPEDGKTLAASLLPQQNLQQSPSPSVEQKSPSVEPCTNGSCDAGAPCLDPSSQSAVATRDLAQPPPSKTMAPHCNSNSRVRITEVSLQPRAQQRKRRGSSSYFATPNHACRDCQGRTCSVCKQGCLQHEPSLLVCCGPHCAGSRIRKGGVYYITQDGALQFCERCHASLPSTLSQGPQNGMTRYKQELLKRRNDEEIAEDWISCSKCDAGVHVICAMHNSHVHDSTAFVCPTCVLSDSPSSPGAAADEFSNAASCRMVLEDYGVYTFVSGTEEPVPISQVACSSDNVDGRLDAGSLKECPVSKFIQEKVRWVMASSIPKADKTVTIRVISDCDRQFAVPEVIQRYFCMATDGTAGEADPCVKPPSSVQYRQKAIAMFQKIDGHDVCMFAMFVQEYDGEGLRDGADVSSNKRVYIAYIDSVEHFRPRQIRTEVFHEILIAYLATARERGYEKAHIWSCPPSRGNCFVFWNHPASQRTPTAERLQAWYHGALGTAINNGVVTDVQSLFESDFEKPLADIARSNSSPDIPGKMICPPLIDGDFWVEEAVRIHNANIAKYLKIRPPTEICVWNVSTLNDIDLDPCPALQVAAVIKDRVMTHPTSVPFRRPVNAVAMKLKNYHIIINKPIDLGTIYARCVVGEYHLLQDVVNDVELMVSNAKRFNPPGHIVHNYANEISKVFLSELNALIRLWDRDGSSIDPVSWESFADASMDLDAVIDVERSLTPEKSATSVIVEDDLSTDATKSLSSSAGGSLADCLPRPVSEDSTALTDFPTALEVKASPFDVANSRNKRRPGRPKVEKTPLVKLDILTGDPGAVMQRMVGEDLWLLEKNQRSSLAISSNSKRKDGKRRGRLNVGEGGSAGDPAPKRRQSWLCEEVAQTVRRMRQSFFTCSLAPSTEMSAAEYEKLRAYKSYASSFQLDDSSAKTPSLSSLADARSALLELCQYRSLEFNTLRRAKYSTSMLLYHLHHSNAPGAVPICSQCNSSVGSVRWHKVQKIDELYRPPKRSRLAAKTTVDSSTNNSPTTTKPREELCTPCLEKSTSKDDFIPIPMTTKST